MPLSTGARRRLLALPLGVLMVALAVPAIGQEPNPFEGLPSFDAYGFQGEGEARVHDLDAREGRLDPSPEAVQTAERLGATDARWNDFGTPHVLINHQGSLSGPRQGAPADVARAFVRENAELFRLDAARVDALKLVKDAPLYDSPDLSRVYGPDQLPAANPDVAHIITLRQTFGGLESALGGRITLGVQPDGSVVYVTSTATGDTELAGESLDAVQAINAAAKDVGMDVGTLTPATADAGGLTFASDTLKDVQRAQQLAMPTPKDGVRRVWGVTLLDTELDEHGNPNAFVTFVDAETGKIWHRTNKVEHLAQGAGASTVALPSAGAPVRAQAPGGGAFTGNTGAMSGCGAPFEFDVPEGTGSISIFVRTNNPNDDLVANILYNGEVVGTGDTAGNPEVATAAPKAGTLPGRYAAQACNFNGSDPAVDYTGNYLLAPVGAGGAGGGENGLVLDPTWRVFPANPPFVSGLLPENVDSTKQDTRVLWCWDSARKPNECAEQQRNIASRVPWDVNAPSTPSFTTDGNNASTAISQASFLTPDTVANRPFSSSREYEYPWENSWFESSCNPSNFGTVADDRNDEQASTANLFVQHNRMHDWSYFLGFTETNFNLQKNNFGNTGPDRENDPELGSSQAGRTTFNGRDNANQITLQDGTPGITNQYLWQPLAGAFYAPCVDGAYDQAVVAHEYGHAITNRMIGGAEPLAGTGATQGQTESWSDLQFAAYFTEFAISAGEGVNPYVLGPYVTGDQGAGIRNYAMNNSPLNYSDLDYDGNGLGSPHANGEIWSATNFDILSAMNAVYDSAFPSSDTVLQNRCARGELPADECPGNRRWNQIQYDSYLLQASGVTMIDSRDAMLAADMLRFGGANQAVLWDAFAKRGLGESASSVNPTDVDAVPGFDSPLRADEARVRFAAPSDVKDMEVFVGRYEARATPIADTVAETEVTDTAPFLPGTYEMIARANGFGSYRFAMTVRPGQTGTVMVPLRRNLASMAAGAAATGDGINLERLIDDTEETNWASLGSAGTASEGKGEGAQVEGRQVTVDLAGDAPVDVTEIQVSAALNGGCSDDVLEGDCNEEEQDTGTQSRFSALRSFDLLACNAAAGADCSKAESFTPIFASGDAAFPSGRPRPRVPELNIRPFNVADTKATHVRLVVRDNQCTGGPAYQADTNPDNDPNFTPDCDAEATTADRAVLSPPAEDVRAAELQVFGVPAGTATGTVPAPTGPVIVTTPINPNAPTATARGINDACPPDLVPRGSRADSKGNFHEFSIDCMVWYEIAKGTSSTQYGPRLPVTRGQMASFVARLIEKSGGTLSGGGTNAFTDDDGDTHEESINKLAAAGIIDGKGGGRYDARGTITRDQMAKFLVNGFEYRSGKALTADGDYFSDDTGNTHEDDINRSATAGFTNGRNGGYEPRAVVQRDAMASFLARMLDKLVADGVAPAKTG